MDKKCGAKVWIVFLLALVMMFAGCGSKTEEAIQDSETKEETLADQTQEADAEGMELIMTIDGTEVIVAWEDNESVDAIKELAASSGIEINMSMYGGFEQIGSIGQSIPRNDEQTMTKAGDIVLYSGNQVVVFYGSNSWAYTRLGRIIDKTEQELAEMLENGDVVLKLEVK